MSDTVFDSEFVSDAMKTISDGIEKALIEAKGERQRSPTYGSAIAAASFLPPFKPLSLVQTREKIRERIDGYLGQMLAKGQLEKATAICRNAVGCVIHQRRHGPVVSYKLNDGNVVKCRRKFYGRRKARVFARNGWKGVLFADLTFRPVWPINHVVANFTIHGVLHG